MKNSSTSSIYLPVEYLSSYETAKLTTISPRVSSSCPPGQQEVMRLYSKLYRIQVQQPYDIFGSRRHIVPTANKEIFARSY